MQEDQPNEIPHRVQRRQRSKDGSGCWRENLRQRGWWVLGLEFCSFETSRLAALLAFINYHWCDDDICPNAGLSRAQRWTLTQSPTEGHGSAQALRNWDPLTRASPFGDLGPLPHPSDASAHDLDVMTFVPCIISGFLCCLFRNPRGSFYSQ